MSSFDTWPPVRIAGTGSRLPDRVVSNVDLAEQLDTSDEWIVEKTGIRERRWAADDEATSDLAVLAALAAMDDAGMDAFDIDLVVVATSTPDFPQPATASVVHGRLGLRPEAAAFDIDAVCSGFVYALHGASSMLACTDTWNTALVIGADTYSRITDPSDRATRVIFGDGAGAVVIEKTLHMGEVALMAAESVGIKESGAPDVEGGLPDDETPGIRSVAYTVDHSRHEAIIVPAGGSREPVDAAVVEARRHLFTMQGAAVRQFAVSAIADAVRSACRDADIEPDSLALLVPHQSNRRILEAAIDDLGLPEGRMHVTVDRFGNTAAASIPVTLDDAVRAGRLREGDLVCLVGYGGGLSSAAVVVRW